MLLVAHGASLDTCTRQLVGGHPRNQQNMIALLKKVRFVNAFASCVVYFIIMYTNSFPICL